MWLSLGIWVFLSSCQYLSFSVNDQEEERAGIFFFFLYCKKKKQTNLCRNKSEEQLKDEYQ